MAKIQEEVVIIKLSKLVKKGAISLDPIITDSFTSGLESIVEELLGDDSVVVEIETATVVLTEE